MNKEIKYILFLIAAVVLAGLVYFLVAASNKKAIVSESPVNTSNVIETTSAPIIVTEPVYTKPIKIEFMDSADKKKIGLDDAFKVQILDRAADGTILGYRVITETNPVIDKFGN